MKSILWRSLFWLLLAGLGAFLLFGLAGSRHSAELDPTFHVVSRYVDQGPGETGWNNALVAVLSDYRAYYLVLLGSLSLVLAMTVLMLSICESFPLRFLERCLLAGVLLFSFVLSAWGALGLWNGGNWMDYEFLTGPSARMHGGIVTLSLSMVTLLGSVLLTFSVWVRGKGQFLGR